MVYWCLLYSFTSQWALRGPHRHHPHHHMRCIKTQNKNCWVAISIRSRRKEIKSFFWFKLVTWGKFCLENVIVYENRWITASRDHLENLSWGFFHKHWLPRMSHAFSWSWDTRVFTNINSAFLSVRSLIVYLMISDLLSILNCFWFLLLIQIFLKLNQI